MTDVFISYSRRDKEFVVVLQDALKAQNRETWIDWKDIPLTADWWAAIQAGIEATNTFVFVITPDSVVSKVCNQEIDHAVKHNKRLVPIVRREGFDMEQVNPALSKHNWLFFREQDDLAAVFVQLIQAIDTDLEYVKAHTRLLVRALEWENKGRNDSFLLRGTDLAAAEQWLASAQEPPPTEQQKNYISKSREAEDANQRLVKAGQQARQMVRIGAGVLGVTLVLAAIVGVWAGETIKKASHFITADSWNQFCRSGSLQEKAKAAAVMFACEKAVALEPDNGNFRDSRGIARARTGNSKGAIEDFQVFIAQTKNQKSKSRRQGWVKALRAGKNPFTPQEIKYLLNGVAE